MFNTFDHPMFEPCSTVFSLTCMRWSRTVKILNIQGLTTIFSPYQPRPLQLYLPLPLTNFTDDTTANFVTFDVTVTDIVTAALAKIVIVIITVTDFILKSKRSKSLMTNDFQKVA